MAAVGVSVEWDVELLRNKGPEEVLMCAWMDVWSF